jgi:flagellar basal-body rod protein FlgB
MELEGVYMVNRLDDTLSFHQSALRIRAERQALIAANIANADTPNFKAKDIDFNAALKQAMGGKLPMSANNLTRTDELHLSGQAVNGNQLNAMPGEVQYRKMLQGNVDGNSVDMDVERNQFIDNALRYEASLKMLDGQLKRLMTAIQGQ